MDGLSVDSAIAVLWSTVAAVGAFPAIQRLGMRDDTSERSSRLCTEEGQYTVEKPLLHAPYWFTLTSEIDLPPQRMESAHSEWMSPTCMYKNIS